MGLMVFVGVGECEFEELSYEFLRSCFDVVVKRCCFFWL